MQGIRPLAAVAAIVCAASVAACAGNPQPGDPGYPYNLDGSYTGTFMVEGTTYPSTVELTTGPAGAVKGTFQITRPQNIIGEVEGVVVGDRADLTLPYSNIDSQCDGVAKVSGPIATGGESMSGDITVEDDCGGTLRGTFSLAR